MKYSVIGAYGCGNVGDEAILEGIITGIRSRDPNAEIVAFAADQDYVESLYGISTVSQLLGRGLTLNVWREFDFLGILRTILSSDKVIIGGGSIIHDHTSYNLIYYCLLASLAKLSGSKVYLMGVSIARIRTRLGKVLARRLFRISEHITVRDQLSYRHAKELSNSLNFQVQKDFAFMNLVSSLSQKASTLIPFPLPDNFIAFNVCGWFHSKQYWQPDSDLFMDRVSWTSSFVDRLIEEYRTSIVFINTVVHQDADTCRRIKKKSAYPDKIIIIEQILSPYQIKEILSCADLLIGMRLHAIIFAVLTGTPFVPIIYDEKVEAFVNELDIPDIHSVSIEDLPITDKLIDTVRSVFHNKNELTHRLIERAKEYHNSIQNGFHI
ncbi:polysaccharide pyruvyl transferase family protein [Paenibacillus sp. Soil724D2]|uniref:polysaccharide pyruvyl transferase family protein n=1 Tax=Paenibacillus sp. (strain Soil724D2) TaxID=1736392 RepID=UPI000714E06C|nr:polysaccharide pyruvyl transferase family protein [Paenibacillus sp. Soil724D2]KRE51068.1 hypothetical protein ASG85_19120 [Paenibacillus sp. Soil724D2]